MKAYHLTAPGLENLNRVDLEIPKPGPQEVLIRLRAASINYLDLAAATGRFPVSAFPVIPMSDGAGEIVELGAEVDGFQVSDKVIPHFYPNWADGEALPLDKRQPRGLALPGSLADYVSVPAAGVLPMPDHLSFEEAAALPIVATTAWNALRAGDVRAGSTVLLLGTGGVSLMALKFAKAMGARVIILSSSDEKLQRAKALGADETINYRAVDNWDEVVLEITGGRGVDLVVETVGSATFAKSLNAAAMRATIYVIGFVSGDKLDISLLPIMLKTLRLVGGNTGSVADFKQALRAIEVNRLKPVVDKVFTFEDAPQAYDLMARGGHFGKLAVTI